MKISNNQVSDYYDQTHRLYEIFWHRDKSYALHYGLWGDGVKNRQEALENENKFLADLLKLSGDEYILDAGCGIGGSCIWLAEHYNVQVRGITISNTQVQKANELIAARGLKDRVKIENRDYLDNNYQPKTFDVVWAIESVCHATDKKQFIKEAYRILKPGGKLLIADGVLLRDLRAKERNDYKRFMEGMALPDIANFSDLQKWIKACGFHNVKAWNKTNETLPSSRSIYRSVVLFYPLAILMYKLGLVSKLLYKNSQAGISQYRVVKSGAAGYGVFYGEKPK